MKPPLKIRLNRFDSISGLEDAEGRSVCQFQPKGIDPRKTAAFIVRACNSHAALVDALSEYLKRDDEARRNATVRSPVSRVLGSVFGGALPEQARAALNLAQT